MDNRRSDRRKKSWEGERPNAKLKKFAFIRPMDGIGIGYSVHTYVAAHSPHRALQM
jgi:hypothetical protein